MVAAVLAARRARGGVVVLGESVDADRVVLRCRAGPDRVTPKTIRSLAPRQQDLIALLEAEAAVEADRLRLETADDMADVCGVSRNADLDRCPVCDGDAGLPAGCLAPALCAVVSPCGRAA